MSKITIAAGTGVKKVLDEGTDFIRREIEADYGKDYSLNVQSEGKAVTFELVSEDAELAEMAAAVLHDEIRNILKIARCDGIITDREFDSACDQLYADAA